MNKRKHVWIFATTMKWYNINPLGRVAKWQSGRVAHVARYLISFLTYNEIIARRRLSRHCALYTRFLCDFFNNTNMAARFRVNTKNLAKSNNFLKFKVFHQFQQSISTLSFTLLFGGSQTFKIIFIILRLTLYWTLILALTLPFSCFYKQYIIEIIITSFWEKRCWILK